MEAILYGITSAEDRIRTPYFIPNEAILIALKVPLDLVKC
jgi:hypothetical protein